MTLWLTSDEHYGHHNIIKYCDRPFTDIDDMSRQLIALHNSCVKPDDTIWHLGDFTMNEKYVPQILKQLNGTHYLVPGNHDSCFAAHKNSEAAKRRYLLYGFAGIYQNVFNFEGEFICSHLPFAGGGDASAKERYSSSRLEDKGQWLLHGHIHNKWKTNGRMINVGVDVWDYKPVSFETILAIKKG